MPEDNENVSTMCWGKVNQYIITKTVHLLVTSEGKVKTFSGIQWHGLPTADFIKRKIKGYTLKKKKNKAKCIFLHLEIQE